MASLRTCVLGALVLTAACAQEPPAGEPEEEVSGEFGTRPLRRLSRLEYGNALRDLLGVSPAVSERLATDGSGDSGFAVGSLVDELEAKNLVTLAEDLVREADPRELVPCKVLEEGVEGCEVRFITTFGRRAFRRDLTEAELAGFRALYASLRSEEDFEHVDALRAVAEAMLQSPQFLYHWELSEAPTLTEGGAVALNGWEMASRLSFLLWASIPDDELLDRARAGGLTEKADIAAEAERMLLDPKAKDAVRSFFLQWLEISLEGAARSETLYPSFTADMASAMEEETVAFAHGLLLGGGTLEDLFLSPDAYANDALESVYGVNVEGDALVPVSLDEEKRPGILTRAGFLGAHANRYEGNPTRRGAVIRRRVLCDAIPSPPAMVPPLPPPSTAQTSRERHEEHMSNDACRGCHQLMDPIGFGLENYDAIGAFRTQDGDFPVDPTGSVAFLDGESPAFDDARGMMELLASSDQVRACYVENWVRFALGRRAEPVEAEHIARIEARFAEENFALYDLVVSLVTDPLFRFRAPSEGEPTP